MIYRTGIIVPTSIVGTINNFAAARGIDAQNKLDTMSVPLVPASGADDATATHFACCGILTQTQRTAFEKPALSGVATGIKWWRWNEVPPDEGALAATNQGTALGTPWGFEQCLAAAGLKRQVLPVAMT